MTTKEMLQFALTLSDKAVMTHLDTMSDDPTQYPTPNGGCHPLWVLGHLTLIEGYIPAVLFGEANPAAHWGHLFGEHTQPVADASLYPSFAEVRSKYVELRSRNLQLLESLSEADLDRPTKAPPQGREREFATFGSSLLVLAMHQTMHRAHATDAQRAAGRGNILAAAGAAPAETVNAN